MKKLKIIVCVAILFLAGAATGYLLRTHPEQERVTTIEKKSEPEVIAPKKDIKLGQGMTSEELYNQLQAMPAGDDFDWTYLTYLAMLRNNETGMSRIAADKAIRPELKKIANEQIDASSDVVNELYKWQKVWGFTDH